MVRSQNIQELLMGTHYNRIICIKEKISKRKGGTFHGKIKQNPSKQSRPSGQDSEHENQKERNAQLAHDADHVGSYVCHRFVSRISSSD